MKTRSTHRWDLSYDRAVALQQRLAPRLLLRGGPARPRLVAGADLSYDRRGGMFYAVVLLLDAGTMEIVEESRASGKSAFPYIPGLLSFREGPLLVRAFRALRRRPDVVLFDGQGIAHPRFFGLASHVGLLLDLPSIGCAKSVLVGAFDEPERRRGARSTMRYRGRTVGAALTTRDGVRPLYVSPGHRIGLAAAIRIVLACGRGYRLPEPTRLAHLAVNRFRCESERGGA